jgi:hypothetical protein
MKDLRKDFDYSSPSFKMSKGHEDLFKARLNNSFGQEPKNDYSLYYKMAAVFIIAVISTVFVLNRTGMPSDKPDTEGKEIANTTKISLGDISPDLKTIEDYYLTSIKLELATLESSSEYDDMVNLYLDELKSINRAYDELEQDLNEYGITEEIINAMIDNLQLRLELLQDLKQKLNNLNPKQNESNPVYQI